MLPRLKAAKPDKFFRDNKEVGGALLECLLENDTSSFKEILETYLRINRHEISHQTDCIVSKYENPTLRTLAKIVHEAVA